MTGKNMEDPENPMYDNTLSKKRNATITAAGFESIYECCIQPKQ